MHPLCPVCGQPTEIEVGFYYGTSYVSYVLTVALSVATLVAWWVIIGLSVNDNRFFYWYGQKPVGQICYDGRAGFLFPGPDSTSLSF